MRNAEVSEIATLLGGGKTADHMLRVQTLGAAGLFDAEQDVSQRLSVQAHHIAAAQPRSGPTIAGTIAHAQTKIVTHPAQHRRGVTPK